MPVATRLTKFNIETGTASATAGAVTLHKQSGKLTSESLTTAAGVVYTMTLTCNRIKAASLVFASVQLGTATEGAALLTNIVVTANTAAFIIVNTHATQALNGTLVVSYHVLNPA